TTVAFRLGPAIGLASTATALLLVPFAGVPAPFSFAGDIVLFAYVLALGRFATVLAALDTGSAFTGMGASREAAFGALAEPSLIMALAALARMQRAWSLSAILGHLDLASGPAALPALAMAAGALFLALLADNARIPFDDPATHLELTMIHEVMVLDHGGIDLAFVEYGAALKLWAGSAILTGVALPLARWPEGLAELAALAAMVALSIAIGLVESAMARVQLVRIPKLLGSAMVLALLALVFYR
ncbi:MAG: NADH-quinone oxidoreductase subunit H, partial [Cyanobacteria bacterium REEB65]|nr:NADH-quinone oxidoreductase subunit H [Cyanobacteria bacterium REEB65]